jgi:hypothetical protein
MDLTVPVYRIIKDEADGIGATNGQSVTARVIERLEGKNTRSDVESSLELLGTAGFVKLERHRNTVVAVQSTGRLPVAQELAQMSRPVRLVSARLALFLAHDPSLAGTELPAHDLEGAVMDAFPGIEELKDGRFLKTVTANVEASRPETPAPLPVALNLSDRVWVLLTPEGEACCQAHHQPGAAGADCRETHETVSGWYGFALEELAASGLAAKPMLEGGAVYPVKPQGV